MSPVLVNLGGCFQGSRCWRHRSWKKRCGEPWRLIQNVDFQGNKTIGSDTVFVPPHESGVRWKLNIISKSVRLIQTCKNKDQREIWNSGRWSGRSHDFQSGFVEHGRELHVSAACSSTWRYAVLKGLKVWGRTFFRHGSVSSPVFTKGFQFACFDGREHLATHSMVLLAECCWYPKGCLISGSRRWVVNKAKFSSYGKCTGRGHQMHLSVDQEVATWACSEQTGLRTTSESHLPSIILAGACVCLCVMRYVCLFHAFKGSLPL